jgi:deazaflavin-dependent oxidoreductase (nitroreductase family)
MPVQDESIFGDEHVRVYEETDGERGYLWKKATTILLLTTTGRKSGEKHTTPLIFRVDDGRWVIVASQGGKPDHPAWFLNMEANSEAELQVLNEKFEVTHSVAEGDERERLWKLMTEVWPDYDEYQGKTDRQIPVVILERA